MGGASAASIRGAEALFVNPAGILPPAPDTPLHEVGLGYQRLLETSYAGSVSYARSLGGGASSLAAGVVYFSQSSLAGYDTRGDPTGSFTPYDFAASAAFAASPQDRLGVGGALKVIRSSLADVSGTTAAVDFGVQARRVSAAGDGPIDMGAAVRNLGPPLKLGSVASPLPLELQGGMLWHAHQGLGVALDLHLPADQEPYFSFGLEAAFGAGEARSFLRLGYSQGRSRDLEPIAGLAAGAGLDLGRMRVDYAWLPAGDLGTTHRVSLGFRL